MKTATLDELQRDQELFKQSGPILVTREGRPIGFFRPLAFPDESIPMEARRERFLKLSDEIRLQLSARGITEEQVDCEIENILKNRR